MARWFRTHTLTARYLGTYIDEDRAARAVDAALAERGLPRRHTAALGDVPPGHAVFAAGTRNDLQLRRKLRESAPQAELATSTESVYHGVFWEEATGSWRVFIPPEDLRTTPPRSARQPLAGYYADETEAARAVDAAVVAHGRPPLNFDVAPAGTGSPAGPSPGASGASFRGAAAASSAALHQSPPKPAVSSARPAVAKTSRFRNVYWHETPMKWSGSILHGGEIT